MQAHLITQLDGSWWELAKGRVRELPSSNACQVIVSRDDQRPCSDDEMNCVGCRGDEERPHIDKSGTK